MLCSFHDLLLVRPKTFFLNKEFDLDLSMSPRMITMSAREKSKTFNKYIQCICIKNNNHDKNISKSSGVLARLKTYFIMNINSLWGIPPKLLNNGVLNLK